jgi:hypothetical protein
MKKGSAVFWLLLYGASLFILGFFCHRLTVERPEAPPPPYIESLAQELGLSDRQRKSVQNLLFEEDRLIRALLKEQRPVIAERIDEIRGDISRQILKLLNEEQKAKYLLGDSSRGEKN